MFIVKFSNSHYLLRGYVSISNIIQLSFRWSETKGDISWANVHVYSAQDIPDLRSREKGDSRMAKGVEILPQTLRTVLSGEIRCMT